MNRELLEKPFDPEQIKQREGNFGKMLDYIEGHAVVKRLNDAFDANWSFAVLKHEIVKETDEVVVIGELSAGDIVKTQFGSSRITRARETGEMVSLADDLKAAATDAIKKCASLMGVGLHLYNKDGRHSTKRQPTSDDKRSAGSSANKQYGRNNRNPGGNGGGNGGNHSKSNNGQGNGRISSKQHKYILDLIKEQGMTKSELNQQCVQVYGAVLAHISRNDASSLIDELLAR